jgi:hypothetical protein
MAAAIFRLENRIEAQGGEIVGDRPERDVRRRWEVPS